jgi:hypothetical protein
MSNHSGSYMLKEMVAINPNIALIHWLKFLDINTPEEELQEIIKIDPAIKKAAEKLEALSSDPEVIAIYNAREKVLRGQINTNQETNQIETKIES